jgi:hypothetical protein
MRQGLPAWAGLALVLALVVLLFAPVLSGQAVLFWGLPSLQFYPWREYAFSQIQAGQSPFWNPYNGGGAPLLANYQTALLYPPNWLHLLLNDAYALSLLALLHVLWAGLGMWLLAGHLGMLPLGRGVSVLCFAFGGYLMARLGSLPTQNAVAWMPWVFWALLALLESRKLIYVGLLAMSLGLLLLVGHAQSSFYILLSLGLFFVWYSWAWLAPEHRLGVWVLAALAGLLGLGIASSQLLFTLQLLDQSQRSGGLSYEEVTNISFAPLRAFNFLSPSFFGTPANGSYLTPDSGIYFEEAIYLGILPLFGAVAAVTGWLQRRTLLFASSQAFRTVPFWVFLGLTGFVLSTGKYGPVYAFLYNYVPSFDTFREPARWLLLSSFSLSLLAGIGMQNWGREERLLFWTRLMAAGGGAIMVLSLGVGLFSESSSAFIPVLTQSLAAFGFFVLGACLLTLRQADENQAGAYGRWQVAVLLFLALDLAWAARGLNPTVPPQFYRQMSLSEPQGRLYWFEDYEEGIKFDRFFDLADYRRAQADWPGVRGSLLPNLNMLDRVAVLNNFDPLQVGHHVRYVELIEGQGPNTDELLWAAGVGQVYGDFQPEGWQAMTAEFSTYQAPEAPPQAWVVNQAIWAEDEAGVEAALLAPGWTPQNQVVLLGEPPPAEGPSSGPGQLSFFEVLEDRGDQKRYRVVTEGPAYLVVASTWYPGWSVEVDGQAQPLYRANLSFMAVALPDGGGEVSLRYLPALNLPTFGLSLFAFFATVLLCLLALLWQNEDQARFRSLEL